MLLTTAPVRARCLSLSKTQFVPSPKSTNAQGPVEDPKNPKTTRVLETGIVMF